MAYKVLICDRIDEQAIEEMKRSGFEVTVKIGMTPGELEATIPGYDAVVVRSATKIRANHIDKADALKLIIRGGVGVDNIDVEYAKKKGIEVKNTPGASSASVAELALAHIFACCRFIHAANVTMRQGLWLKKDYEGIEVSGKTLGIIGIGRIGKELAKRAIALGMNVVAYDTVVKDPGIAGVKMLPTLDELLATSDIISLHVPKQSTGYLIGKAEFEKMKKGAILINCSRGGVVDESALLEALNSGKLWGAGIDVFEKEPTDNTALVNHPRVSVTPHLGASTFEAQARVGGEVVAILKEFFKVS